MVERSDLAVGIDILPNLGARFQRGGLVKSVSAFRVMHIYPQLNIHLQHPLLAAGDFPVEVLQLENRSKAQRAVELPDYQGT